MKFLEYVVSDLYRRLGGNLQDTVVVLPTRRAGIFVRDYLGELAADRPVCAPQCTTITELLDDLCPLRPADEVKAVCLLYKIYCDGDGPALTLDAFYGWGRQLIVDFNNIEKAAGEYTVEAILRNSMEARHFDESKIDEEVRARIQGLFRNTSNGQRSMVNGQPDNSFRREYEKLWRRLPEIHARLTEALRQEGCALEGARSRWVVEHFVEILPQLSGRTFAFVGFNRLLAVERKLMHLMKEQGIALFYWDYDRDFDEGEDGINVYQNVRRNIWLDDAKSLENLGGHYEDNRRPPSRPPIMGEASVEIIAAPSDSAQARYVHDWLLQNHREGERTAVVICNESQLQHVVFAIPPQLADNVNITKGFPLRNTRIYAEIVRRLHAQREDTTDFAAVLQSLLNYIDSKQEVAVAEDEDGSNQAALAWHELLAVESIYQARLVIVKFLQLISDGTLSDIGSLSTLRNLLLRHLATVSIPFHGEPITDIQVIGVLETRALDFDNILFLNVEEGVLPKVGKDKSFIPYYLRKYFGLPTNDEQTETYAYNFFRLLRRARRVTILYGDAQTASGQKTMSRFVMQMLASNRFSVVRRQLVDDTSLPEEVTSEQAARRLRQLAPQECYAEMLRARAEAGNEVRLSPSAIKTFLTCPMKFFIRYLLGVPEPDTDDTLLQGNELGTLIHNSAEVSYERITDNYSKPLTPEAIRAFRTNPAQIDWAVGEAFRMMNDDYRLHHDADAPDHYQPEAHQVEASVARKHLKKILENDEQTRGLNIVACERDAFYDAQVCGLRLRIGGRIDRVDSVPAPGGECRAFRIADYKTGRHHAENMAADSLDSLFEVGQTKGGNFLQTLIYCLAVSADSDMQTIIPPSAPFYPVLFYTQKKLEDFDPRLTLGGEPLTDFRAVKAEFEQKLLRLVELILTTRDFPMAGTDQLAAMTGGATAQGCSPSAREGVARSDGGVGACDYCKYSLLCARRSKNNR